MNNSKFEILEHAFIHLEHELGNKLEWWPPTNKDISKPHDTVCTIDGKKLYIIIKNEIRPSHVSSLLNQDFNIPKNDYLIVANYITPNAKKILKDRELNFIDRAGNIFLRIASIHIHIDGIRNQPIYRDRKNSAFTQAGIKVVFHLLNNPQLANEPYRHIMKITGVSLGTIPKVFEGLKEDNYLLKKTAKEWVLINYSELLDRWKNEYINRLKPTLYVNSFRSVEPNFPSDWKQLRLLENCQWGGEPAGELVTQYLIPAVYTLYSGQTQQQIMKNFKWIPDPEGDIHVYKKFWEMDEEQEMLKHVPAILAYADLMESADQRCIETAKIIYEKYIQKH